ncbi:unnamed protein product [Lampetra fluviatilis]
MELYWYIIVIMFVLVKILFYVCWYRSRQRQLHTYLANPGSTQVVIVGSRAYLHRMWQRRSSPAFYSWYPTRDAAAAAGSHHHQQQQQQPAPPVSPAPSYCHLEVPPAYEDVTGTQHVELTKPPPYSECVVDLESSPALLLARQLPAPATLAGGTGGSTGTAPPPPYTPHRLWLQCLGERRVPFSCEERPTALQ